MNQNKNTIKIGLALIAAVILGEGILGWGLYWPLLLILIDWSGVYWVGVLIGVMVSVFSALPIGLPSLFIVGVLGVVQFFLGVRRGFGWWLILISLAANIVFDLVFGLSWSVLEFVAVLVVTLTVFSFEGVVDSIKVSYK